MEYNVTGLQPATRYSIQVAALTRKGDGDRSLPIIATTPGGVPIRATVNLKILERDPTVSIELEWERPAQTYGELRGYRLRWGIKDNLLNEETLAAHATSKKIKDLERGVEYEFRVAGMNLIGIGQETVKYLHTPEGVRVENTYSNSNPLFVNQIAFFFHRHQLDLQLILPLPFKRRTLYA